MILFSLASARKRSDVTQKTFVVRSKRKTDIARIRILHLPSIHLLEDLRLSFNRPNKVPLRIPLRIPALNALSPTSIEALWPDFRISLRPRVRRPTPSGLPTG
jgi:hypothetical protein